MGSEKGTPSSITSAPASAIACITMTVSSGLGSPATMKVTNAAAPSERSCSNLAATAPNLDFKVEVARHWMQETIEIKVRNHKTEPVKVIVKENLYRWTSWQITKKTHEFEKIDSRTIHFPIELEKDGEVTIRYTVHYTW